MKKLAVIATISALAGCAAPVPVPHNFPLTYQKVARTAQHWNVVADDVVDQTVWFLATSEAFQGRGVFVPATQYNTAFDATFRDFLITHLVDRGAQVSVCAASGPGFSDTPDVQINYETRIIAHAEMPQYKPGVLTALASGVFVVRSLVHSDISTDGRYILGIGAAALADVAAGHATRTPRTEIIVTTTVQENNRFIMRRNDVYYVPEGDANLFVQRVAQSSLCPGDRAPVATTDQPEEKMSDAEYRSQWFIKEMRRINPLWREPTPPPSSWSYPGVAVPPRSLPAPIAQTAPAPVANPPLQCVGYICELKSR